MKLHGLLSYKFESDNCFFLIFRNFNYFIGIIIVTRRKTFYTAIQ